MRFTFLLLLASSLVSTVLGQDARPVRIAVAGMSHGHVGWILGREDRGDVEVVGYYETDARLVGRLARQYGFDEDLVYAGLGEMLDAVRPEAVVAFGSIYDHLMVVEAAAPRGIHVMVEKPLAANLDHALRMEALAKRHGIHLLVNYETTWYPSTEAVGEIVQEERLGPIRKVVVHDGHEGPKEIGVSEEFLAWLTDPVLNGGGALMDFGCYGANLITWLMDGQAPLSVTAVTQQIKPDVYPRVDDEATIVLAYPQAQAIIQASWNWPFSRKDLEVYGKTGYAHALDGRNLRIREEDEAAARAVVLDPRPAPNDDPFAFLASVVRGEVSLDPWDLSALPNNVMVMRILDAAKRSAESGETVTLARTQP